MKAKLLAFVPGVIVGLYAGRLLSELWAVFSGNTPLALAIALTGGATAISIALLLGLPFERTWPSLLLLYYLFLPEASLSTGLVVGLLAALLSWQTSAAPSWQSANPSSVKWAALVAALLFFLLYLFTLAPDLLPADNGEFQVVAAEMGVAHPPGFPLYTLIAHLMTRLPIGPSPAFRVNLLSAITSALTLIPLYATVTILSRRHLAAITAAVAFGTATTVWAQATTANIRSLSALFAALLFLTLVLFYQAIQEPAAEKSRRSADRFLIGFALILGLAVTHHASLAFIGLTGSIFVLLVDPSLLRSPRRWWKPLLAFLLGFLPLLYLPLRAASGARGASPDLATGSGFLEHALALGFRGDLFSYLTPDLLWERLQIMGNVLTFQFAALLLAGMFLGLLVLIWRDWRLAFLFGGAVALHTFVTATYRAPQTVEYMLPAYVPMAILLGTAAGDSSLPWTKLRIKGIYVPLREILAVLLLLAGFQQLVRNYPSYERMHQDISARDYAQSLLEAAPSESVILADWHWVTPLWYLQEIEGQRPDVSVRFVYPEGESYAENWARRIQEELDNGQVVISTHFEPGAFAALPTPEPLLEAFLFRQEALVNLPDGYTGLEQILGDKIELLGYQVSDSTTQVGQQAVVNLAWQATAELDAPLSLFAHLVSSEGQVFAQQDIAAQPQPEGITITQFRLAPRLETEPGSYTLFVGAYDSEPLRNGSGEERIPLTELDVAARSLPQATGNALRRSIPGEEARELVGYDWDNSLPGQQRLYLHWRTPAGYQTEVRDGSVGILPSFSGPWGILSERWSRVVQPQAGYYVPFGQGIVWTGEQLDQQKPLAAGQSLTLSQRFLSSQPVLRDYAVSVRLMGYEEDGYHWAWWDLDDGIPAMGAIPTLKWIAGSEVRSPHFVTVDASAPPGQELGGALNLYDAFTSRVLPILDQRITADYSWLPLGTSIITE